jgi:lipopolysaccharide export system protein LptC
MPPDRNEADRNEADRNEGDWSETPEVRPEPSPGGQPKGLSSGSGPVLTAPRRVFKRKKRNPWLLALKVGLPLIAVAGVVYVVIWWREATNNTVLHPLEVTDGGNGTGQSTVSVAKVKYDGVDAQNRPFSITADSATQPDVGKNDDGDSSRPAIDGLGGDDSDSAPPGNANGRANNTSGANNDAPTSSVINLNHLIADMTMADGAWVAVLADSGVYNRDTGVVDLSGNVNLFHDTGLSFVTDAATVDVHNDSAKGNQPIEGQRPNAEIVAEGFDMRKNGRIVTFTGRAYLKLYPKPKASPSGAPQKAPAGSGAAAGKDG